jgi:multicomponent Na+:H+ antiporter subunit B
MSFPVESILFVFLVATAISVVRLTDLFAAAMLTGIFSLLSAGLFTLMDAVDVAFTEAAVGAGISTVLMVSTLALTRRRERGGRRSIEPIPLLVVVAVGSLLVWGTFDMPPYGDPEAPIHKTMAPRFIERSAEEVGPPNIVTSILASYRGYDTFGETTVVFTAAVGVLLLLGGRLRPRLDARREPTEGRR